MRRYTGTRALAVLAFCFAFAASAMAQSTGGITGVVKDDTGAVIPGATVTVTNVDIGQTRNAVSDAEGFFSVPLLRSGSYKVEGSLTGFKTFVREGIEVEVNRSARVDLTLSVGSIEESVTVVGDSPLVETTHATLGIVIDEKSVVELPLNGRNFAQLGTLMPGVVASPRESGGSPGDATPGGFGNPTGSFNVNGMRNQSNNFLLDGMTNNDTFNTGFNLRPPPDAIQEFKIQAHSFSAEYGRNAGSVVDVASKSGTNNWHGSGWIFRRDDSFESRNFFADPDADKPKLDQNQFGGSIGGPLVKDKLFVFGYYEGYRNSRGQTDNRLVGTAAQRTGDFSGLDPIIDPVTGLPFPGNVIPADRLHPSSVQLLNDFVPLPNTGADRLTRAPDLQDDRNQFGVKIDFQATDKDSFLFRYVRQDTANFNPLGGSNFSPEGSAAEAVLDDFMVSYTRFISPTMINQLRFNMNNIDAKPTTTSGIANSEYGLGGIPNTQPTGVGLTNINISGYFTLGDSNQPFAKRDNNVWQIRDDLTWLTGAHSLKFGFDFRHERIFLASLNRPNGNPVFNGSYTGDALADFLLGYARQFRQGGGDPEKDGTLLVTAGYVQDEWRVSPQLTLNLGLRYEVTRPFVEKEGRVNRFSSGQQSTVRPDAPAGLVYPGDSGVPDALIPTDKNNFAPRVNLVYDLNGDGRTTIRAGWGLFYDGVPGQADLFQNILAPPFNPLTQIDFPDSLSQPNFQDPYGVGGDLGVADNPPIFQGFQSSTLFIGWGSIFHDTPQFNHWNLSVQREIFRDFGLEVAYVGTRGKNVPTFITENPGIVEPGQTSRGARRYSNYNLLRPTYNVAKIWYDGLQVSLRKRYSKGYQFLAAYTWSKAEDHDSSINVGGGTERRPRIAGDSRDPSTFDAVLDSLKGPALYDARHVFSFSGSVDLPKLQDSSAIARGIFGNWQLNGIIQARTGFPFHPRQSSPDAALTYQENFPDQVCDPNAGAPHTVDKWFNTECFVRLTLPDRAGDVGNSPRNSVRGPNRVNVDMSLFKNIPFGGSKLVQLRFEVFNVFNRANFRLPQIRVNSSAFGVISSADDGRILQLGAKVIF